MPIPIQVPRVGPLRLPSDIMSRIAQGALRRTQAQTAAQTSLPLAQALLQQRQQTLQQGQQAFPLLQQQRQATIGLAQAQTQQVPLKTALLQAQIKLANMKASQPHLTNTELAYNAWHSSWVENPKSGQTAILGQALVKTVRSGKGATITTPGGTTVSFGGTTGGGPIFFPQAGQTVGGAQPTVQGAPSSAQSAPLSAQSAPLSAQSAAPQLTGEQQAIQNLFGPPAQPSPVAQVGGIGGSRKQQGITLVDPATGRATTTPTRQVTTLNQNAVESAQKLATILPRIASGYAPFAGFAGEGRKIFDKVLSGLDIDPSASDKIQALNEAQDNAKVAATDLMRAVGAPSTQETEAKFEEIFRPRFGENPEEYKKRILDGVTNTVREFSGTAAAAQVRGIILGTIKPGTLQFKARVSQPSIQLAPKAPTNIKTATTAQLIQQFGGK